MAKNLSDQGFIFPRRRRKLSFIDINLSEISRPELPPGKNMYFDNYLVEQLLYKYIEGSCTHVKLRDEIMSHASELIRQIIRANNLQSIYPGKDEASFGDLFQVAWVQVESVLYKYEALPHCLVCFNHLRPQDSVLRQDMTFFVELTKLSKACPRCSVKLGRTNVYYRGRSKVFNMWSQVARTVVLAHIKRESRDRKNQTGYKSHLVRSIKPRSFALERLLSEMRETFKYNEDYLAVADAIEKLYEKDDKPHEGFIAKLVEESGKPRALVNNFLKMVRLRQVEFTDVPGGDKPYQFSDDKKSNRFEPSDE